MAILSTLAADKLLIFSLVIFAKNLFCFFAIVQNAISNGNIFGHCAIPFRQNGRDEIQWAIEWRNCSARAAAAGIR